MAGRAGEVNRGSNNDQYGFSAIVGTQPAAARLEYGLIALLAGHATLGVEQFCLSAGTNAADVERANIGAWQGR